MPQFYDIIMHLIRYGERAQIALRNEPFCLVMYAFLSCHTCRFTTAGAVVPDGVISLNFCVKNYNSAPTICCTCCVRVMV